MTVVSITNILLLTSLSYNTCLILLISIRRPIILQNSKIQILLLPIVNLIKFSILSRLQTLNTIVKSMKFIKSTLLFLLLSSTKCYYIDNYCSVPSIIIYKAFFFPI